MKAHGFAPKWRKGAYRDPAAESLQQLQAIDLHWHDLRHEYASRLVERKTFSATSAAVAPWAEP